MQESDDFWASLAYPVLNLHHGLSTKLKIYQERFGGATHLELQRTIIQLNDEIGELQARNLALMAERQYWQDVREMVEFGQQYADRVSRLGQIFFRSLKAQGQFYLVNLGANDGIKSGMVAVYQNCLVGKVAAVYPQHCKVTLLTDRNCKVAAYSAQSGAVGICRGLNLPDQLSLEYVSHLQNLVQGDQLLSSGDGELFPQGFGLGIVTNFVVDGMYYRVVVKPSLDFAQLKYCYLINPNKS
jgi:rod shape-determining protein MreC